MNHICLSCRRQALSRRSYASTATAAAPTPEAEPSSLPPTQWTDSSHQPQTSSPPERQQFTIKAGVVVSRPPILTPDPHPFETAYHLYQRRLNERLVLPFTQYFYFKRGTPAFEHWRTKRRARAGAAARDIGAYSAYGREAWNDEVLLGNEDGSPREIVRKLIEEEGRAAEFVTNSDSEPASEQELAMGGLRRTSRADELGDQRSLERSLSRTLYLLVKMRLHGQDGSFWRFPCSAVQDKEGLKEAAHRTLAAACGVNMNTWFVGNHPIGHFVLGVGNSNSNAPSPSAPNTPSEPPPSPSTPAAAATTTSAKGEKIFFMKSRIMAGQADIPPDNALGVEDFKWLAKEEIQKEVGPRYWASVRHMLVDQ